MKNTRRQDLSLNTLSARWSQRAFAHREGSLRRRFWRWASDVARELDTALSGLGKASRDIRREQAKRRKQPPTAHPHVWTEAA